MSLFKKSKILVIGDAMLDRYSFGSTNRISPEAPVPVLKVEKEILKPGGAANVASNISSLGQETTLISSVGTDSNGKVLKDLINSQKVKVIIIPDIESVNYGRGVGYDIIEHVPPQNIGDISATKIRKKLFGK